MSRRPAPNVLSIGGSDPSGGAGIQADLKTFAALGVYGCAVPAVLTAQNTVEVSAVLPVPAEFVRRQLDALFSDVRVAAVKIGMLGTARNVRAVAAALREYAPPFVVLDPVLRASTGGRLAVAGLARVLHKELRSVATVVTPNAEEAGALLGSAPPRTVREARRAAQGLVAAGWRAALVTGGHLDSGESVVDLLYNGRRMRELRGPRVAGSGAHGTGCTLSSAIASLLAQGRGLAVACAEARAFVAESIARSEELRVGRGVAPAHPLGALWERGAR